MRRVLATVLAFGLVATAARAGDPPEPPDPLGDLIARAAAPASTPEETARRPRDRRPAPPPAQRPVALQPAASGSLTLAAIRGLSDAALKARLGPPALERAEGAGALWTYRLPGCALLVFLVDQGGLKVVGAEASPLERGASAPPVDVCLAGADPA